MKYFLFGLALLCAPLAPASAQYVLNLREADIRAFIQDASRVTGRTFIIDPAVQGRVSVVTDRALSRSEYFELFLATLRANGFVAVPTAGGALRVRRRPAQRFRAGGHFTARSHDRVRHRILRVRSIDAAAAVETLRPLVRRDGSITAGRNSLVVSDFADNIRRVRQVLAQIDVDGVSPARRPRQCRGPRNCRRACRTGARRRHGGGGGQFERRRVSRDSSSVAQLAAIAVELDRRAASGSEIRSST